MLRKLFKLAQSHGGFELAVAEIEAKLLMRTAKTFHLNGASALTDEPYSVRQVLIVGDGHAAVVGGEVFLGVEREAADVADRTGGPAFVLGKSRLADVLDQDEVVLTGDFDDGVEIA